MEKISPIGNLLSNLREPKSENKKHFEDYLPEAQKLFGLEHELDVFSLDALLIQAIIYCVFKEMDEPEKPEKDDAKKRDAYLLALGLLDNYYHTKKDGTHYSAFMRHKQYLYDSDFIALRYPNPNPSDNLDIEDAASKPRGVLSSTDNRCRQDLEKYLSDSENCKKCLEEGAKKFIKTISLPDKKENKQLILPKPLYTLENFPLSTKSKNESDVSSQPGDEVVMDDVVQQPNEFEKTDGNIQEEDIVSEVHGSKITEDNIQKNNDSTETPDSDILNPQKNTKKLLINTIIAVLAVLAVSLSLSLFAVFKYEIEARKQPETIEFDNPDIYLPLGEPCTLPVKVNPPDSDIHHLKCESSNPETVEILSESNLRIKATDSFKSNISHDATIKVYLPDNDYITDKIIVHVFDLNANGSSSEGRNNNLSSGDFIKE